MDSSIIQSVFGFMTNHIFSIIYLFVAVEIFLVINIFIMMKKHQSVLLDVSDNLLKGFSDAPDKDSTQSVHERIESVLDYMGQKVSQNEELRAEFIKNASKVSQRPFYTRHYKIEMFASVMSTIVQVFPLLGILGTILAIAQTAFSSGGQFDVTQLSSAFVLAMDTTIFGILFSVIFMVVESTFQPKIERVINESMDYKRIISKIHLANN